jgi:hypothetical protein
MWLKKKRQKKPLPNLRLLLPRHLQMAQAPYPQMKRSRLISLNQTDLRDD